MSRFNKNKQPSKFTQSTKQAPIDYTTKDDLKYVKPEKLDYIKPDKFHPFQSELLILSNSTIPEIVWIYDLLGGTGKDAFMQTMTCLSETNVKFMGLKYSLLMVPSDVKNIFINLTESKENINYNILHSLQDGKWTCENELKTCNHKNIFVFSNFMPKNDPLLEWRYKIYEIKDLKLNFISKN